jgi:hypothetical protein
MGYRYRNGLQTVSRAKRTMGKYKGLRLASTPRKMGLARHSLCNLLQQLTCH